MLTFVIIAFVFYMAMRKKAPKDLLIIPFMLMIGCLIASAYILPLIFEKRLVNTGYFMGIGKLHFEYSFLWPSLSSKLPSGDFWPFYYGMVKFSFFFFFVLMVLLFFQVLKMSRNEIANKVNAINKFFLGTSIMSMFLLFGPSSLIWKTVPFFEYIQYPGRWLNITAFATVFLSAAVFRSSDSINMTKRKSKYPFLLFCSVCLVSVYSLILGYHNINSAPIITQQKLKSLSAQNFEHLPIWLDRDRIDRSDFKDKTLVINGEGRADVVTWRSAERVISIQAAKPLTLRVRTFYFPGWRAYVDGVETPIKTEEESGAMLINVPLGTHTMKLTFEDSPIRYYGKIISLFSAVVLVFVTLFGGVLAGRHAA
jgi:hypothetical protein